MTTQEQTPTPYTLEEFKHAARYGHEVHPNDRIHVVDYDLYLRAIIERFKQNKPLVGDCVELPDGQILRIAELWPENRGQLAFYGSYCLHPDTGRMSMSGGLEPAIDLSILAPSDTPHMLADAWYFSQNHMGAHRGVYLKFPVRLWAIPKSAEKNLPDAYWGYTATTYRFLDGYHAGYVRGRTRQDAINRLRRWVDNEFETKGRTLLSTEDDGQLITYHFVGCDVSLYLYQTITRLRYEEILSTRTHDSVKFAPDSPLGITPDEDRLIRDYWEHLPGSACYMDALRGITAPQSLA